MKKELDEFKYKVISETKDGYKKQLYWNIAFGLQEVDDLKPSTYMIGLAKKNIEGKLSYSEVEDEIRSYYKSSKKTPINEQEADMVSVRIVNLLSDNSFRFDYNSFKIYHKYLFSDIDIGIDNKYVGNFRDYNISKDEPILNGDTVSYTNYYLIEDTLKYDFDDEKQFDYSNKTKDEIAEHLAKFTSNIWQVHPFGEGNTRTTALFIQKYIQYLGFGDMNNDIFKDNSKYFRNALVRANYRDVSKGIHENITYLNKFFSNLILKTDYELNNEDLYLVDNENELEDKGLEI